MCPCQRPSTEVNAGNSSALHLHKMLAEEPCHMLHMYMTCMCMYDMHHDMYELYVYDMYVYM